MRRLTLLTVTLAGMAAFAQPSLRITRGAVAVNGAATKPGVTFSGPVGQDNFPYSSDDIAADPVTANVSGFDAQDVIRYRLLVENIGDAAAYDVRISDTGVAGFLCSVTDISNGSGTSLLEVTPGQLLTTGGVTLLSAIAARHPTSGANIVAATVECTVPSAGVGLAEARSSTFTLHSYAAALLGANVLAVPVTASSQSTFATAEVSVFVSGAAPLPVVRDVVTFGVTVQIPEGTFGAIELTHLFAPGLAFASTAVPVVTPAAGVSFTGSSAATISPNGQQLTWALGTVTNANNSDAFDTLTTSIVAVLLNVPQVQPGAPANVTQNIVRVQATGTEVARGLGPTLFIRQPTLAVAQFASPPAAGPGDVVTVTAIVSNAMASAAAAAHEPLYRLTLPTGCAGVGLPSVFGVTGTVMRVGQVVTVSWPAIAPGEAATVTATCSVPMGVPGGSALRFESATTWSTQAGTPAQLGANAAAVERTGGGGVDDLSVTRTTMLTLRGASTSLTRMGTGGIAVGQSVDFTGAVTVPEGMTGTLDVKWALPAGLSFVSSSALMVPASVLCDGGVCAPTQTVTNDGGLVSLRFDNVNNTDTVTTSLERLSMTLTALVTNVPEAQRGGQLTTSLMLGAAVPSEASIVVAEPTPSISLAPATTTAEAGSLVRLSARIQLPADTTLDAPAHDTTLSFTLPPRVSALLDTLQATAACGQGVTIAPSLNGVDVLVPTLVLGSDCLVGFEVRLSGGSTPGSMHTVTADVSWSSRPGQVVTPQTPYNPLSTERTGSTRDPGGAVNTYRRAGLSTTFNVTAAPFVVAGALTQTSSTRTVDPAIAIGERATYSIRVQLPQGLTPAVAVVIDPPPSMRLASVLVDRSMFTPSGTLGSDPSNLNLSLPIGQTGTFAFGTVNNPPDGDTGNDTVVLTVVTEAHFDVSAAVPGNHLVLVGTTGSGMGSGDSLAVQLVMGRPQIHVNVAPTLALGGTGAATFVVSNDAGTEQACITGIASLPPAGLRFSAPEADGLDNDFDGQIDEPTEALLATASGVRWAPPGCLDAGTAATAQFRVTAAADAGVSARLSATLETYFVLRDVDAGIEPSNDAFDTNGDGVVDGPDDATASVLLTLVAPMMDADHDGLSSVEEVLAGTNPNDADSDDDGVSDGAEIRWNEDTDADGLINALDPDSDNDGLPDGLEQGVTEPLPSTQVSRGAFVADADPLTRTSPVVADVDQGGVRDGAEDTNKNGRFDVGERNPLLAMDDQPATVVDSDGDGLSDAEERAFSLNPNDADSDDDGVIDGAEALWHRDFDADGVINALDPDSDGDGIFDGTEAGLTVVGAATDVGRGFFVPDADPTTKTSPWVADTDRGGVSDGAEDTDKDGRVGTGEMDPLVAADDALRPADHDGDGLTDAEELAFGLKPDDADSDDDGLLDGQEPDWRADTDGDGQLNALDADADGDGILDGTEAGLTTPGPSTNVELGRFVADADPSTRTSVVAADTDHGGISDGREDSNANGRLDLDRPGGPELDPLDPADDLGDRDGDGLRDIDDNCRLTSNASQADLDGDGLGDFCDIDFDGDGILNGIGISGGGCATAPAGALFALALVLYRRRKRA